MESIHSTLEKYAHELGMTLLVQDGKFYFVDSKGKKQCKNHNGKFHIIYIF
jgi:hypothetical protein